jgi:hypothetical protein
MTGNCEVNSKSSNIRPKCQLKIIQSSYNYLKYFSDMYSSFAWKQASFTVTSPRQGKAQDLEGGYVTLRHAQGFIFTSKTLFQTGM